MFASVNQNFNGGYAFSLEKASIAEALSAEYKAEKSFGIVKSYIEGPKAFSEKRAPNWKGR